MNTLRTSVATVIAVALAGSASLRATTSAMQTSYDNAALQGQFQPVEFRDHPEAEMLHRAYRILATGDHDYRGHRAEAMKQVKKAADLLGYDLGGDDQYHEKQFLSDDKMREARDLLNHVLGAAEVKGQEKISKHIDAAISEIDAALATK